jgi:hypothetical protein
MRKFSPLFQKSCYSDLTALCIEFFWHVWFVISPFLFACFVVHCCCCLHYTFFVIHLELQYWCSGGDVCAASGTTVGCVCFCAVPPFLSDVGFPSDFLHGFSPLGSYGFLDLMNVLYIYITNNFDTTNFDVLRSVHFGAHHTIFRSLFLHTTFTKASHYPPYPLQGFLKCTSTVIVVCFLVLIKTRLRNTSLKTLIKILRQVLTVLFGSWIFFTLLG